MNRPARKADLHERVTPLKDKMKEPRYLEQASGCAGVTCKHLLNPPTARNAIVWIDTGNA